MKLYVFYACKHEAGHFYSTFFNLAFSNVLIALAVAALPRVTAKFISVKLQFVPSLIEPVGFVKRIIGVGV